MLRLSLSGLFLAIAFIACLVALVVSRIQLQVAQNKVNELTRELDNTRPVPFFEVRRQFTKALQPYVDVNVSAIRYSPVRNSYFVKFGWLLPGESECIGYTVELLYNGDGYSVSLVDDRLLVKVGQNNDLKLPIDVFIKVEKKQTINIYDTGS